VSNSGTCSPEPRYHWPLLSTCRIRGSQAWRHSGHLGQLPVCTGLPPSNAGLSAADRPMALFWNRLTVVSAPAARPKNSRRLFLTLMWSPSVNRRDELRGSVCGLGARILSAAPHGRQDSSAERDRTHLCVGRSSHRTPLAKPVQRRCWRLCQAAFAITQVRNSSLTAR